MKVWNLIAVTLALALAVAGCGGYSKEGGKEGASTSQPTSKSAGDGVAKAPQDQETPAKSSDVKAPSQPAEAHPGLKDPSKANETAPETYKVKLETTKGDVVIQVTRAWSPIGADRFYNLAKVGFFDGVRFFRVLKGFMAQFGMNGDPAVTSAWQRATIKDDPVVQSNKRGFVTFAKTAAPNSRGTQLFINFGDNGALDRQGFSPIGQVVQGMEVVDSLYNEYGEGAPSGKGPRQDLINQQGNAYLEKDFPNLDYIKRATIVP